MSRDSFKSFEDLECWKACTEVRRFVSELVKKYPKEEKFGLVDDMKRSGRSTTHNLAEGFGRFHSRPVKCLRISCFIPTFCRA
jgi:four helix bundle protein